MEMNDRMKYEPPQAIVVEFIPEGDILSADAN